MFPALHNNMIVASWIAASRRNATALKFKMKIRWPSRNRTNLFLVFRCCHCGKICFYKLCYLEEGYLYTSNNCSFKSAFAFWQVRLISLPSAGAKTNELIANKAQNTRGFVLAYIHILCIRKQSWENRQWWPEKRELTFW